MPVNHKAFNTYIANLNNRFKGGNATEHTYRGDLQTLLETLLPNALVTNEPTRIACGAPDYIITKNDIPVGYIEAKDLGADLKSKQHKAQFDRYRDALNNLIITNYLDFEVYKDGQLVATCSLGFISGNKVVANTAQFDVFAALITDFATLMGQTIKSSQKLAEMMAGKAKLLAEVISAALQADEETEENSSLEDQLKAFKDILIHDIKPEEFADIYAQTIAYGMFAARLHDPTLDTFTRREAAELIPKSNPFLRKLFQHIAGFDLDNRIVWIVDALADIFRATDVAALLKNFGKATQANDPIIHFYETFLSQYNPKLRKARGVWYTPEPVVKFIVRAVDDILKTEFGLEDGLADRSKTKVKVNVQGKKQEREMHRVQILDPATGTGTFLAEVVKYIYNTKFSGQQGVWSSYVENHLVPRLNGFELLMASYAMAHLKLDMLLTETGYKPTKNQRLKIYLTNSLEEHHPDAGTLFASWLSDEANEANAIKRDTPVMVIIGNPPYSGESANKGEWIMKLMEDYKKEPGGIEKLKERNPKWINDDYVKFIRFGQHFIEKNGEGILAFINPHGYLDNPTFRGMRWNLLKTYDKIYTIDLHGNAKKKEVSPDGSPDINVFDIQQGVSINLFIKTGKKKTNELGEIYHFDLFGKRDVKYDYLLSNRMLNVKYSNIPLIAPTYFFTPKNFKLHKEYNKGFYIKQLLPEKSVGIVTGNDPLFIDGNLAILTERITTKLQSKIDLDLIKPINYRIFDSQNIYFNHLLIARPREKLMKHFYRGSNLGLALCKQFKSGDNYVHVFITDKIIESSFVSNRTSEITSVFPLYLYPDNSGGLGIQEGGRTPNLNKEIVAQIAKGTKLTFTNEKEETKGTFAPIDVLDYIYAVLHSPAYREKYKEFLKIDFPRVPYPTDVKLFWQLVALGGKLRQLHLLEGVNKLITQYPVDGDNSVDKPQYTPSPLRGTPSQREISSGNNPPLEGVSAGRGSLGRVYINDTQYFEGVPQVAWEFYIGGYQPAQKWLKDRKGRTLTYDDIEHYQKIIVALTETDKLMQEINTLTADL